MITLSVPLPSSLLSSVIISLPSAEVLKSLPFDFLALPSVDFSRGLVAKHKPFL
jgi:hypothetical protein